MKHRTAEIIREFGPFPGIDDIAGVSFGRERVWFASGDRLNALDPESGEITGSIATAADAGTASLADLRSLLSQFIISSWMDPRSKSSMDI